MTQAAVAASNASLMTTPVGTAPSYMARAWVNFNGTGTVAIRASGNVSSITDNGTGDYTINFATAMVDANYSISGATNSNNGAAFQTVIGLYATAITGAGIGLSAASVRVVTAYASAAVAVDVGYNTVSIFR